MNRFKLLVTAAISATVLSLAPMQTAQAADPVAKCSKAAVKYFGVAIKQINVAIRQGCKAKLSPAEIDSKVVAKVNKAADRANAVDSKLDCQTNADPDIAPAFPLPATTTGGAYLNYATQGATICDGIATP